MPRRPTSSAREGDGDRRRHTFAAVEAVGLRTLGDNRMGPARTKGARKDVRVHRVPKSAEPNSRVVMIDFADRDAPSNDPATFYLKEHYLNHPCARETTRIRLDALRDLVVGAHRFVNVQMRRKSHGGSRRGTARPSRDRR